MWKFFGFRDQGHSRQCRATSFLMALLLALALVSIVFFQLSWADVETEICKDSEISELVSPCFVALNSFLKYKSQTKVVRFGCCSKGILNKCFDLAYVSRQCETPSDIRNIKIQKFTTVLQVKNKWFNFTKPETCNKFTEILCDKEVEQFKQYLQLNPCVMGTLYFGFNYENFGTNMTAVKSVTAEPGPLETSSRFTFSMEPVLDDNDTELESSKDIFPGKEIIPVVKVEYSESEVESSEMDNDPKSEPTNHKVEFRTKKEFGSAKDDGDSDTEEDSGDEIKELVKNEEKDDDDDEGPIEFNTVYTDDPVNRNSSHAHRWTPLFSLQLLLLAANLI